MKTIMARTSHESSFSSSKRYFQWRRKKEEDEEALNISSFSSACEVGEEERGDMMCMALSVPPKKKKPVVNAPKLRSVLTVLCSKSHWLAPSGHSNRVVGTLFGYRNGHINCVFQEDPSKGGPVVLTELAAPTDGLVLEMASGVVRIVLECDKKVNMKKLRLLEEPTWRMYCNGRKCGPAKRRECGPEEWKVLRAVEPISVGAGVLPGIGGRYDGEIMYIRARFERAIGSKDSEAFYMINPDSTGGSELSVYFLRV